MNYSAAFVGVALAVSFIDCAPLDDCPAVEQSAWGSEAKIIYQRTGMVVATRPSLSVGNDCETGIARQMAQADICAPSVGDEACVVCLKAHCCEESILWFGGASGQALGECVEQNCAAPCPRSGQ